MQDKQKKSVHDGLLTENSAQKCFYDGNYIKICIHL